MIPDLKATGSLSPGCPSAGAASTAALRAEHWRRRVAGLAPHPWFADLDDATLAARLGIAAPAAPTLERIAWFGPKDDRRDPGLASGLPPALLQHARRTCYLVGTAAIATRRARRVRLHHVRYGDYNGLCPDDPFWCQPVVVEKHDDVPAGFGYSGYLVDAWHVLTCWHGWDHFSSRAQVAVFGHVAGAGCAAPPELPVAQVLPVAARPASDPGPVGTDERGATRRDWVLLRLEHPVTHLGPLSPPRFAAPRLGQPVYTLGHPCGLPLKLADGASVLALEGGMFRSDLDTFTGNSGSPVFDAATHALVGLVVEGQKDQGDFEPVPARGCYVARQVERHVVGQLGVAAAAFAAAVTR